MKTCESNDLDRTVPLRKSINAYICDFVITWLTACDDLPKSLKNLVQPSPGEGVNKSRNGDEPSLGKDCKEDRANNVDDLEGDDDDLKAALAVVTDKKTKLETITLLFSTLVDDMLDTRSVEYFKNISKLKKHDSSFAANGCAAPAAPKSTGAPKGRPSASPDEVHAKSTSAAKADEKLSGCLAGVLLNGSAEVGELKNAVEQFERERMSAPNPFIFVVMLRVFLAKHKEAEPELVAKLENLLERTIDEGRIMED